MDPTSPSPLAIATRGLSRRLGGAWALRSIDLQVAVGRAVMVFGSNGAGKTTLIRVLGTALRPSGGSVELFGGPPVAARARVGMLSHADHHYDDLSARENLLLGAQLARRADHAAIDAVLTRVGLSGRSDEPVRGFSAGMRKRLAFARLLLKAPDLVLLDEPYAQLDPAGHLFVDALIRGWIEAGTTVLVSTHQVARVGGLCHDAVQIDKGRVVWTGAGAAAATRTSGAEDA